MIFKRKARQLAFLLLEKLSKQFKIPHCALEDVRNLEKHNEASSTKHYKPRDYTKKSHPKRHSGGGTTKETLSKHYKIQRCALKDVHNLKKIKRNSLTQKTTTLPVIQKEERLWKL